MRWPTTLRGWADTGKATLAFILALASFLISATKCAVDQRVEAHVNPIADKLTARIEEVHRTHNDRWIETNVKLGNLMENQSRLETQNNLILKAVIKTKD